MKVEVKRHPDNPVIIPDESTWYAANVYNPGVINFEGTDLLLVRGTNDYNQLHSNCGVVFLPSNEEYMYVEVEPSLNYKDFGSLTKGGIEDPRIVEWLSEYYIFATAYGAEEQLSSETTMGIWKTKDFRNYDLVNTPFEYDTKDAGIVQQVYDDKKVYLIHRPRHSGVIEIAETNDVTLSGEFKNSRTLLKLEDVYGEPVRIGMSGPPIRFGKDWLVTWHGKYPDDEYSSRYELSFMILDGENPKEIKYLHDEAILKPEDWWEIDYRRIVPREGANSVKNVVFSNGIIEDRTGYTIYYGGSDSAIGMGRLLKKDIQEAVR